MHSARSTDEPETRTIHVHSGRTDLRTHFLYPVCYDHAMQSVMGVYSNHYFEHRCGTRPAEAIPYVKLYRSGRHRNNIALTGCRIAAVLWLRVMSVLR